MGTREHQAIKSEPLSLRAPLPPSEPAAQESTINDERAKVDESITARPSEPAPPESTNRERASHSPGENQSQKSEPS